MSVFQFLVQMLIVLGCVWLVYQLLYLFMKRKMNTTSTRAHVYTNSVLLFPLFGYLWVPNPLFILYGCSLLVLFFYRYWWQQVDE